MSYDNGKSIRTFDFQEGGKIAVRLRLTDGRERQLFYKTKLEVLPEDWDARAEGLKSRKIFDVRMRREFEAALTDYKTAFEDIYEENRDLWSSHQRLLLTDGETPSSRG
jgi:hypothetical protein